jgi:hypothetical protein
VSPLGCGHPPAGGDSNIRMTIFLFTVLPLAAAFLVHFLWWQIAPPRRQLCNIFLLYLMGFLVAVVAGIVMPQWLVTTGSDWWWSMAYVAVFYWAVALSYMITYSAMEGDSPTLALVLELRKCGTQGFSRADLEHFFVRRPFLRARLQKLLEDGMLRKDGGGYRLARSSSPAFELILWWRRRILGLNSWGG